MNDLRLRAGEILLSTEEVCRTVRKPLGILISEDPPLAIEIAKLLIKCLRPVKTITVGDFVTWNCITNGIIPHISIIDGRVKRRKRAQLNKILDNFTKRVTVVNPPSSITFQAWKTIERAMSSSEERTLIRVIGEEDLLTLAVAYHAPLNSVILYGQPDEGLVLIHLSRYKKDKIKRILLKMSRRSIE